MRFLILSLALCLSCCADEAPAGLFGFGGGCAGGNCGTSYSRYGYESYTRTKTVQPAFQRRELSHGSSGGYGSAGGSGVQIRETNTDVVPSAAKESNTAEQTARFDWTGKKVIRIVQVGPRAFTEHAIADSRQPVPRE